MSSFLSAAENAARQRQNVRCDFKKKMGGENTRAVELTLEGHSLFIFWSKTLLNINRRDRSSIATCCIDFFQKHKRRVRKQTIENRFEFFFILFF